jgi:RPA family protein/predicted transcriptional regulator
MEYKRLTAIKTRIKPITSGKFVIQQGFNPSYVLTADGLRLSRVRILGTVVYKFLSENGKFAALTLDDGTDTIRAKAFNSTAIFDHLNVGDILDVVGKIKEYQEEVYMIPEVLRRVEPNFEILRELEIRENQLLWKEKREIILEYQKQVSDLAELKKLVSEKFNIMPEDVEAVIQSLEIPVEEGVEENRNKDKEDIMKMIAELDKGEGCDYSELIEKSNLTEDVIDFIINDLLTEGACFEPRPGKIKRL